MCRVYNTIGSLITIQNHLINNDLDEFNSLNELISFQKNYQIVQQQIISNHNQLIIQEKQILETDIAKLTDAISNNKNKIEQELKQRLNYLDEQIENLPLTDSKIIPIITDYYKNLVIWIKIWLAHLVFYYKRIFEEKKLKKFLAEKQHRLQYILLDFQGAVTQSSHLELEALRTKKEIIGKINNTIYGAIGEQKVVEELKNLSDEYILINDFTYTFDPPLYQRKENTHIKTIQIDHLLISTSGIFIIETKNWSQHSIDNLDFYSPVSQVKRANYALFKIVSEVKFNFKRNHWGDRKITIRNLIVLINNKPIEEFQFVKILTLNQLLKYINYFTPSFTLEETQNIADYLLSVSHQNRPTSKLHI